MGQKSAGTLTWRTWAVKHKVLGMVAFGSKTLTCSTLLRLAVRVRCACYLVLNI